MNSRNTQTERKRESQRRTEIQAHREYLIAPIHCIWPSVIIIVSVVVGSGSNSNSSKSGRRSIHADVCLKVYFVFVTLGARAGLALHSLRFFLFLCAQLLFLFFNFSNSISLFAARTHSLARSFATVYSLDKCECVPKTHFIAVFFIYFPISFRRKCVFVWARALYVFLTLGVLNASRCLSFLLPFANMLTICGKPFCRKHLK